MASGGKLADQAVVHVHINRRPIESASTQLLTQKDLLDVMEAVMKEQSGVHHRQAELEDKVSDLEADRDQVVNRHIETGTALIHIHSL